MNFYFLAILYIIGMGISHSLFSHFFNVYKNGSSEAEKGAVVMMWLIFYPIVWIFILPSGFTKWLIKKLDVGTK